VEEVHMDERGMLMGREKQIQAHSQGDYGNMNG
jgi:hypothetical protein